MKIDKYVAAGIAFNLSILGVIVLSLWHLLSGYTSLNYIVILVIASIVGTACAAFIERTATDTKYEKFFPKNT